VLVSGKPDLEGGVEDGQEEEQSDDDEDDDEYEAGQARKEKDSSAPSVWDDFLEIFIGQDDEARRKVLMRNVPYYFLSDELGIDQAKMLRISLEHGQVRGGGWLLLSLSC
jgi:hypothetical protein